MNSYLYSIYYESFLLPADLKCHDLLEPDNGQVMVIPEGNYPDKSVAHYSCNQLHTLSGNSTRTCQNDGQWSGNKPTYKQTL